MPQCRLLLIISELSHIHTFYVLLSSGIWDANVSESLVQFQVFSRINIFSYILCIYVYKTIMNITMNLLYIGYSGLSAFHKCNLGQCCTTEGTTSTQELGWWGALKPIQTQNLGSKYSRLWGWTEYDFCGLVPWHQSMTCVVPFV